MVFLLLNFLEKHDIIEIITKAARLNPQYKPNLGNNLNTPKTSSSVGGLFYTIFKVGLGGGFLYVCYKGYIYSKSKNNKRF